MSGSDHIRIFILTNNLLLREGISKIIRENTNYSIVGVAKFSDDIIECLKINKPDLLLIDLTSNHPDILELIVKLKETLTRLKIICIGASSDIQVVINAFISGISGYLLTTSGINGFKECCEEVMKGGYYIDDRLSKKVITRFLKNLRNGRVTTIEQEYILSRREQEVLRLIAEGKNTKEIADILYISPKTVQNHKYNIMKKLDLKNVVDMVKYAIKIGIVDL